jgi:hypothetical protein
MHQKSPEGCTPVRLPYLHVDAVGFLVSLAENIHGRLKTGEIREKVIT